MILRFLFGLIRWILLLAVLTAGLGFAWVHRDTLRDTWREWTAPAPHGPVVPSPALADSVESRLSRLADRHAPTRLALAEVEVQSFVQYRLMDRIETAVITPKVDIGDGRLRLSGRVPVEDLGAIGRIESVMSILPDTTDIEATLRMIPYERGRVALEVIDITAAKVPLPERMIPGIVNSLVEMAIQTELPANVVVLPLPDGARAAYLSGDSLVFLAGSATVAAG